MREVDHLMNHFEDLKRRDAPGGGGEGRALPLGC